MSSFEAISASIALLALTVSAVTAYKTFYGKFKCEFFIKPRLILTQFKASPALVIGCEIMNSSTLSGAVDDVLLAIKYKAKSSGSTDKYTFLPKLLRDNYSVYKVYTDDDFEPFQTIALTAKSRFTKYVVFSPANNFSPSEGDITLQLFFRVSGVEEWIGSNNIETLRIDEKSLESWIRPNNPESIMLETKSNFEGRCRFMDNM